MARHAVSAMPPSRRAAKAGIGHNRPPSPLVMEPLAVRRREATKIMGVGLSTLKELIRAGDIKEVRIGHASLVTVQSMREFLGLASPT